MTKGDRIRNARETKGATQEELAKAISTTKQTIYKYESNIVTNIPSDKIELMAKFLGVSESYLMGWESSDINNSISPIILAYYNQLNDLGKREAEKRVQELTYIPMYSSINDDALLLNAAHADNYADAPDELKELEERMMDEDF